MWNHSGISPKLYKGGPFLWFCSRNIHRGHRIPRALGFCAVGPISLRLCRSEDEHENKSAKKPPSSQIGPESREPRALEFNLLYVNSIFLWDRTVHIAVRPGFLLSRGSQVCSKTSLLSDYIGTSWKKSCFLYSFIYIQYSSSPQKRLCCCINVKKDIYLRWYNIIVCIQYIF